MSPNRLLCLTLLSGCLHPPAETPPAPEATTASFDAEVCASGEVAPRPLKLLLVLDAAPSLSISDPNGTRATAVLNVLDHLPQQADVSVGVMVFAGNTRAFLLGAQQLPEFHPLTAIDATERSNLATRILQFQNPPGGSDSSRWVDVMYSIYGMLSRDVSDTRINGGVPARYEVVVISDGSGQSSDDDELFCGDAIVRLRSVTLSGDDVRLHTVHVFEPAVDEQACDPNEQRLPSTSCRWPGWPAGTCAFRAVTLDAERLERMAEMGGGQFHDFRNGAPVDLSFAAAPEVSLAKLETVIATNFSVAPAGDGSAALAFEADSDGDGFSDSVEAWAQTQGRVLPSCAGRADSDCDGLLDCDEGVLGSNAARVDTDLDGIPDGVEWQHGTRPAIADNLNDLDADGVPNGEEIRLHGDPTAHGEVPAARAYRYQLLEGRLDALGSQCYRVNVDNIAVAEGSNDLYLAFTSKAGIKPLVRQFRFSAELPKDKVVHVAAEDFRPTCAR